MSEFMGIDLAQVLEELPPFSKAVDKLLQTLQKGATCAHELESLLIACPVIAGRVLHIANSTFYGFSREITSIREAIVILGQHTLQNLVYTVAVIDQFSHTDKSAEIDINNIWQHSLYSACAAQVFANELQLKAQELFTAGVFQHLGLAILIFCRPQALLTALAETARMHSDILSGIETALGVNYYELSERALETWHFPVAVCRLTNAGQKDAEDVRASILGLSNCLADAMGFTLSPGLYAPVLTPEMTQHLEQPVRDMAPLLGSVEALFTEMRQGFLNS